MTQQEADIDTLMCLPAFHRFMFRIVEASGLMRAAGDVDLARMEGKRSLAAEILRWCDDAMPEQHTSGLPVGASIQLLSSVRNESVAKEKTRRGGRSRDDGDDD